MTIQEGADGVWKGVMGWGTPHHSRPPLETQSTQKSKAKLGRGYRPSSASSSHCLAVWPSLMTRCVCRPPETGAAYMASLPLGAGSPTARVSVATVPEPMATHQRAPLGAPVPQCIFW